MVSLIFKIFFANNAQEHELHRPFAPSLARKTRDLQFVNFLLIFLRMAPKLYKNEPEFYPFLTKLPFLGIIYVGKGRIKQLALWIIRLSKEKSCKTMFAYIGNIGCSDSKVTESKKYSRDTLYITKLILHTFSQLFITPILNTMK